MSAELSLRRLDKKDLLDYRALRLSAFQESPNSFSESFEDEQSQPIEFFQTCMGDQEEHFSLGCFTAMNQLVGIATFKRDKRSKARHKSYIHTMYVAPQFRGKNVGTRILDSLIETARSMHRLEQIHLWVLDPPRSAAKGLYAKAGFGTHGAVVGRDLKIDGAYVDAEYMVLFLN